MAKKEKVLKEYLITGIYFDEIPPVIRDTWETTLKNLVFHGVFYPELTGDEQGYIYDHNGFSIISDLKFTSDELSFTKTFQNSRKTIFRYKLKKYQNEWLGSYKGEAGKGAARCYISKTNGRFLMRLVIKN